MSEQIYDHLPRWRRVIHDLAVEASLEKFLIAADAHDKKLSDDPNSSELTQVEGKR